MTGHTPGPWIAGQDGRVRYAHVTPDLRGAMRHAGNMLLPTTQANARLIAAAPALLEACEAQHQAIDILFALLIQKDKSFYPSKSGKPWDALIQANAARAKAKGGG